MASGGGGGGPGSLEAERREDAIKTETAKIEHRNNFICRCHSRDVHEVPYFSSVLARQEEMESIVHTEQKTIASWAPDGRLVALESHFTIIFVMNKNFRSCHQLITILASLY